MTTTLLSALPAVYPLQVGAHTFPMVSIPGGTFTMGDEHGDLGNDCPKHEVELSAFSLGQFPVTQALWRAVLDAKPGGLEPEPSYFKGAWRPVERVSWEDTVLFLQKLNDLLPGRGFRLPTEAEWEYAARAGTPVRYAGSERLDTVAWYGENSHGETRPVGLKMPNAWGLFDMSGNVWEWCQDWYGKDYYKKSPPKNPVNDKKGSYRVVRGGSWIGNDPQGCRVACRDYHGPSSRYSFIGFRLAALPPSQWR